MKNKINIEFRQIKGFPGLFVSEHGIVISHNSNKGYRTKALSPYSLSTKGYGIDLFRDGKVHKKKIHRLVADAFIANPKKKSQVNHRDGDRFNNHVSNLEWVTASENMIHSCRVLKQKRGGAASQKAIRVEKMMDKILSELKKGTKQKNNSKNGRSWSVCYFKYKTWQNVPF